MKYILIILATFALCFLSLACQCKPEKVYSGPTEIYFEGDWYDCATDRKLTRCEVKRFFKHITRNQNSGEDGTLSETRR